MTKCALSWRCVNLRRFHNYFYWAMDILILSVSHDSHWTRLESFVMSCLALKNTVNQLNVVYYWIQLIWCEKKKQDRLYNEKSLNYHSKWLRIHYTFTLKITMNETFDYFQCSTLIPRQDRPHKVYISLKLRAFWMYSQQEKRIQAHFELQQYFESSVYHTLN